MTPSRYHLLKSVLLGVAAISTIASQSAYAADASNGKLLYNNAVGGIACSNSICHGPNPAADFNSTMKGANNPTVIGNAITSNAGGTMGAAVKFSAAQLADIAAYIANPDAGTPTPTPVPTPGPTPGTAQVVEYFHASFGHYFITASPEEAAAIDAGNVKGWTRTGETFKVFPLNAVDSFNVCRFFSTSFTPKSSHFYTPSATECAAVKNNPNWQYEGLVFSVAATTASGACAFGTTPLYRLYNDGKSGAPNHRYTVNTAVRAAMLAQGWIPEGQGALGVVACVPI